MNLIRTSCIRIPLQFEKEEWCKNILRDLTRTNSKYEDPTVKVTSAFYERKDGNLWIPRFYPIEGFGHSVLEYLSDGDRINFKFKSRWRNKLQEEGFNMLTTENHGILKLLPGEGKTVIAIGAICYIGRKAIIFVHKDSLLEQWKERFIEHSTITEKDVGIVTTAKCREIFQKSIVLCTVQTMNSMIDRTPNLEKELLDAKFGIAIWDECHTTTGAVTYSRSSLFLPCKRVFGLSATPGRADQNHDIIWKHLGLVYSPDGETDTMQPKIIMIYFDHKAVAYHKQYIYWGPPDKNGNHRLKYPKFDTSRYLAMLISKKNDKYIPMMRKIVRKVYHSDRITLFISDRIKVLDRCATIIPNKADVGFFIPRSKEKRAAHLLRKFVFSTPGSSRDGTDRQALDCLIMANCISNIEQAVGRICRSKPNKKEPVVFDIVDTGCDEMVQRAEGRIKFYESKGWKIEKKFLK